MKKTSKGAEFGSLQGGAPKSKKQQEEMNELQLSNRGTDCFVNCIVQLIRNTAYMQFINDKLPNHLHEVPGNICPLSRSLLKIYHSCLDERIVSTAQIRKLVAEHSNRFSISISKTN